MRAIISIKPVLNISEPDKSVPLDDKTNERTSERCAYVESGFVEIGVERNRWDRQVRVTSGILMR